MSANEKVAALIERQVAEGRQIGVQVCAYKNGEVVVDDWAGRMGPHDPRPVQANSLFSSWSTTKGVAATAFHILADRGLIDYDAPVAEYWPGFARNGKDGITVAQAMSHQSGIHATPRPYSVETLTDWEAGIRYIEDAEPAYEPGTATGYHAYTYGLIVGGIVQGATGKHIRDVIRDEIARPLGVEDEMYVGIPEGVEDRLTTLGIWDMESILKGMESPPPPGSDFFKAMPSELWRLLNLMPVRKACIPGANGHFTARALAKMYAALAGDGSIDGVRLVSPGRIKEMQRVVTEELDIVLGTPARKGIGFFLGGEVNGVVGPLGPRRTAFGHAGAGGSIGFADPEARLSVGVTKNRMEWADPGQGCLLEICDLIREEQGVA
jgi:CubicO group peptidase (beta-lactamase class C family)